MAKKKPKSRARQLAEWVREMGLAERAYYRRMRKELKRVNKQAANLVARNETGSLPLVSLGHFKRTKRIAQAFWDSTSKKFARIQADNLARQVGEKSLRNMRTKQIGFEAIDDFALLLQQYLDGFALQNVVSSITNTTMNEISKVISEGVADGVGSRQIARDIRKLDSTISRSRALTIARTETHSAASWANYESANVSSIPNEEMQREWLAVNDDRTRDAHSAADGQTVGMNESYEFDDPNIGFYTLRYPGDPNGPAAGVINCRCGERMIVSEAALAA